jgi:hypothetical protein
MSDGEPDRQRRPRKLVPVGRELRDGTTVQDVELWDHCVVLRWAKSAPPRAERYISATEDYAPVEPPWGWDADPVGSKPLLMGWTLDDDLDTVYDCLGGGAGGGDGGWSGKVTFEPAPPGGATLLRFRQGEEEITVSISSD